MPVVLKYLRVMLTQIQTLRLMERFFAIFTLVIELGGGWKFLDFSYPPKVSCSAASRADMADVQLSQRRLGSPESG